MVASWVRRDSQQSNVALRFATVAQRIRQRFSTEEAVIAEKGRNRVPEVSILDKTPIMEGTENQTVNAFSRMNLAGKQDSSFRQAIQTGPPLPGDKEVMHTQVESQIGMLGEPVSFIQIAPPAHVVDVRPHTRVCNSTPWLTCGADVNNRYAIAD